MSLTYKSERVNTPPVNINSIRKNSAERDLPNTVRRTLWLYSLNLQYIKRNFAPRTSEDEPHELWEYALQNLTYAEYLLESFDNKTPEEKIKFAVNMKEDLKQYEKFNRVIDYVRRGNADRG